MFQNATLHLEGRTFHKTGDATAEERLWRAVVARTLEEWLHGPRRYSRMAEEFLFDDNRDFPNICSSAGMDAKRLRNRLMSLRARGVVKNRSGESATPETGNLNLHPQCA